MFFLFNVDPPNLLQTHTGTTEIEDETVAKEMEHAQLQDSLDKELEELNKRLEQKEVF
jgi:kinesin family protein 4/21/27